MTKLNTHKDILFKTTILHFRVIARNKVGESLPSVHSKVCLTPEDVPYKNPDNVEGRGTKSNNLVIYWTVSSVMRVEEYLRYLRSIYETIKQNTFGEL